MEYYYDERNQFPSLGLPIPGLGGGFPGLLPPGLPFGGGGFGGFGGGGAVQQQPRPIAQPIVRPAVVAQPIAVAPPPAPAYAYQPPPAPPPMPYGPPPMYPPYPPPPGLFGPFGGPCGGGLLGGLFGNRRALPIIVDNVLKGFAAFGGTPELPTGDQLTQVRNLFTYLNSAAQFVKRDEQLRFFGGLARDIL
jgi:hypothetical protein